LEREQSKVVLVSFGPIAWHIGSMLVLGAIAKGARVVLEAGQLLAQAEVFAFRWRFPGRQLLSMAQRQVRRSGILNQPVNALVGIILLPLAAFLRVLHVLGRIYATDRPEGLVSWIVVNFDLLQVFVLLAESLQQGPVQLFDNDLR